MDFENLHQILRSLYDEMMPLCSDMTDIAKGLAGLGALFYVAPIGPKAFEHCSSLKSIRLSSNLEYIGPSAFLGCTSLKEIHLPSSLKTVGEWAFSFCHFDKVVYDGTILEADKILRYETNFSARILETKDGTLDFTRSDYYADDYHFQGSEKEWREKYGSHWLNRRARRIHTNDGKTIEN